MKIVLEVATDLLTLGAIAVAGIYGISHIGATQNNTVIVTVTTAGITTILIVVVAKVFAPKLGRAPSRQN